MKKLILLLPVVLLFSCSSSNKSNVEHFVNSIEYVNEANKISNGSNSIYLEQSEVEEMIRLKQRALGEARKVNISSLNKRFQGFGDSYEDLFIEGLNLYLTGMEDENQRKVIQGQLLLDEWGDWYSSNINRIRRGY